MAGWRDASKTDKTHSRKSTINESIAFDNVMAEGFFLNPFFYLIFLVFVFQYFLSLFHTNGLSNNYFLCTFHSILNFSCLALDNLC